MLILPGQSALSDFAQRTLLGRLAKVNPAVTAVDAVYLHFVEFLPEFTLNSDDAPEVAILQRLMPTPVGTAPPALDLLYHLGYLQRDSLNVVDQASAPSSASSEVSNRRLYLVLPRHGTISPWSSKATDIAHDCQLSHCVKRIERGIAYFITADPSLSSSTAALPDPTDQRAQELLACFADRMTQTVWDRFPSPSELFLLGQPRGINKVQLTGAHQGYTQAKDNLVRDNRKWGLALADDEIDYLVRAFTGLSPDGSTEDVADKALNRSPTDVELMMFAQVNSEHCRHKIFNASWTLDGQDQPQSLFKMIKNTYVQHPQGVLSAYSDNASVLEGPVATRFHIAQDHRTGLAMYQSQDEPIHILCKVETHNHPTAVSPFPGAATGSGGEIRDEGSVGRGSKPKAGMTGFIVSHLHVPGWEQPWESTPALTALGKPAHIASPLDIMLEAPIGGAAFNNEYGRPNLTGFFRTFAEHESSLYQPTSDTSSSKVQRYRGFHKPIMIAGGLGNVREPNMLKHPFKAGAHLVVLGGPAMLIGLGGGAASSMASGASSAALDFASVQRENPEMERRCQEVIDACSNLPPEENPILFIHDVGAGGLSNALPELVHDSGLGALIELRDIPVDDPSMSPMEIWCNESQERYVLAVHPDRLDYFRALVERERCPMAVVGKATDEQYLRVTDRDQENTPNHAVIDLPMDVLFGKPPKMHRTDHTVNAVPTPLDTTLVEYLHHIPPEVSALSLRVTEAAHRILKFPAVASKSFLITIGDRSVSGLVAQDQMVGPWQVPVADVAVTASTYVQDSPFTPATNPCSGEAMATGERPPLALLNPAASARMAVGEALTNLIAADVADMSLIRLSANWMCAAQQPGEGAALYQAVQAIGMELCPALGIAIPVGKDSMSMKMTWPAPTGDHQVEVTAPLSLIITGFAPVTDVRRTLTPMLQHPGIAGYEHTPARTCLVLIDLAAGRQRLGGSALAQVFNRLGETSPDVDDPALLRAFFQGLVACKRYWTESNAAKFSKASETPRSSQSPAGTQHTAAARQAYAGQDSLVLAYHDRSDGGLFTTIVEMALAARTGVEVDLTPLGDDPVAAMFNEELGAVVQVAEEHYAALVELFASQGFPSAHIHRIGCVGAPVHDTKESLATNITFKHRDQVVYTSSVPLVHQMWTSTSHQMQRLRDNAECADQEYQVLAASQNSGLNYRLTFSPRDDMTTLQSILESPTVASPTFTRPRVGIVREQGVNGHLEMAHAFFSAGFEAVDIHMSDLLAGRITLASMSGLAFCGGFSYGDVLGAASGWALSCLLSKRARTELEHFIQDRKDTFLLGVCNGCQFLSKIKELIPGTENWPTFLRNKSEQFEARFPRVQINPTGSLWHNPRSTEEPTRTSCIFLRGMVGSQLPISSAHGEGRAEFPGATPEARQAAMENCIAQGLIALQFVDNQGEVTERYPANPNGSPRGITGLTTPSGRVLAMMPHPERVTRTSALSWVPPSQAGEWGENSPWFHMFVNARAWVNEMASKE
ncbi:phosphoribosylformylglycinamidine synthase [Dispira parvispora]|uniref:Phosphoribosylformylglycinamidine synthase n=1 Tax=Dispira parvispora TaxID=1520584 RepID=A0A9W8ATQ7_9FUNG|nr:phosphoribosylformylglycinamidine synthase [Dispira parvispora]